MASSLSPECTPLKHQYDNCFNSWFEGYLEPVVDSANGTSSASSSSASPSDEERQRHVKQKAEEYEASCGKVWASYRECLQKAVAEKGLDTLLNEAREENPLNDPLPSEKSS